MALIEINWQPTDRQLRQFGLIAAFALPLIGWLWGASVLLVSLLASGGLVIAVAGMAYPRAVRPLFLGLTIVASPIGIVVSELTMLLMFFGLFLPIGLVFRLIKRDALQLKFDRRSQSYWQPKQPPGGAGSYYRQF
jgi:hypothetical protein